VSAGGYQTPAGSGNGPPLRVNPVARSKLWQRCRDEVEASYPFLAELGVLNSIEALMVVLDVEEDARYLAGVTWLLQTPDDYSPVLMIYFTYIDGAITLQAVHAVESEGV
jgi:hypothetical protein